MPGAFQCPRASRKPAKPLVAVGDDGPHAERVGQRQRVTVVRFSLGDLLGIRREIPQEAERPCLIAALLAGSGEAERFLGRADVASFGSPHPRAPSPSQAARRATKRPTPVPGTVVDDSFRTRMASSRSPWRARAQHQAAVVALPGVNVPRAPQLHAGPKGAAACSKWPWWRRRMPRGDVGGDQAEWLVRQCRHAKPLLGPGLRVRELTQLGQRHGEPRVREHDRETREPEALGLRATRIKLEGRSQEADRGRVVAEGCSARRPAGPWPRFGARRHRGRFRARGLGCPALTARSWSPRAHQVLHRPLSTRARRAGSPSASARPSAGWSCTRTRSSSSSG